MRIPCGIIAFYGLKKKGLGTRDQGLGKKEAHGGR